MKYQKVHTEDLLPDDPTPRCGYYFLSTSSKDPFINCCILHDSLYGNSDNGQLTRKEADTIFFNCMITQAGDNKLPKLKAYTYYYLARIVGIFVW